MNTTTLDIIKVSKEDFVQALVDCKGDSREDAEACADEYRNDLGAYILDTGGNEESLQEARNFLGI